ncbi:hypothetical protein DIT71_16245 [Marinobacter vulgaris]|uniref:Integrase catalytic domain-containing protein n=1 Tax=Marinobacter vulgaris TaxID=1928331 RepID=A0A2V3ZGP4_9GAMM|nr:hypothetical protein DIT71_16245 [Marinobacter vulgaris]TSJ67431.1 transposase family protein [Marinobacter vulgaris]
MDPNPSLQHLLLATCPATSIPVLERTIGWRGYPPKFRMNNDTELISVTLADWAEHHGIAMEFIKPGTPTQDCYVERFNRAYRDKILNMYVFRNLTEARQRTES